MTRTFRPLPTALNAALATLMIASVTHAQAPAGPANAPASPVGIVAQPCPAGSIGRTDAVLAFATSFVSDGPLNPAVMSAWAKEAATIATMDAWRQKNDWADLCLYRQQNADAQAQGGVRVVFLGDSITELWKAADPDLFTGGVLDRGVSGQTSAQILLRFQQDVVELHPSTVHILIGTNDVAGNTGPERLEDFKNNVRAMAAIARANRIHVVLGAVPPAGAFPWRPELNPKSEIPVLNAWLSTFAKAEGMEYADYYTALAGPDGAMKPGISRDGVHPRVSGYAIMKPIAKAAIERAQHGPAPRS